MGSNMSKLLIASLVLATVCADADSGYVYGVPALHNAYPNWPGVSTPYSSSTCYGCRPYAYGYGLRPYGLGVAGHPGAATSFVARSPQGLGKRSADAEPGYLGYLGYHPYGYAASAYGISQLHPSGHSFQHVARGKRSADADADAYYRYGYGYPYAH